VGYDITEKDLIASNENWPCAYDNRNEQTEEALRRDEFPCADGRIQV